MKKIALILIMALVIVRIVCNGQITTKIKTNSEEQLIRNHLKVLTDTAMHGRGYVKEGKESASQYIQNKFKEYKLRGITKSGTYVQGYNFPVNTFPAEMKLVINKTELVAGEDFIIDPASVSFTGQKLKYQSIDLNQITDTASWLDFVNTCDLKTVYYFNDIEPICKVLNIKKDIFPYILPRGCFMINGKDKLTWSVKLDTCRATLFYILESALPKKIKTIDVAVDATYIPKTKNDNIIGFVTGKIKDTFIAFTAHYDHLGMMGNTAIFPGASDNASGTSMLLYLANYFSTHPQRYSILFIAFSGEEAELMGSRYYTKHPIVPLKNIKFLTNIDIMGDATNVITVVNATEYTKEFDLLQRINNKSKYIPVIKPRGKAANSDHYFFTEAGVPSFFFYSNGGKGFYHDIYDKGNEVSLKNVDGVARLIIDFTNLIE